MLKRNVSSSDIMTQNLDGTGLKLVSVPDNKNQNGISSWGGPWCKVIYAVWSDAEPAYIEYANRDGKFSISNPFFGAEKRMAPAESYCRIGIERIYDRVELSRQLRVGNFARAWIDRHPRQ